MTTSRFYREAEQIAGKLMHIHSRVSRTVEVLERLVKADEGEIEVHSWEVRYGQIFITLDVKAELQHVQDDEKHIQTTLTALFPTCIYSGTLLAIESSELL